MFADHHTEFEKAIGEFNRQQFFECHESLETIWRECEGELKILLQGIIHTAVGFFHLQRKNMNGARRQLDKGLRKFNQIDLPAFEKKLNLHLTLFQSEILTFRQNLHLLNPQFPKIK